MMVLLIFLVIFVAVAGSLPSLMRLSRRTRP
jgi:hypothetical protein